MQVHLLPAFEDNYFFVMTDKDKAFVVDPGEAGPVLKFLSENKLQLEYILVTHHHHDHIGGVPELQKTTGAKLFGPSSLSSYGLKFDTVLLAGDQFTFHSLSFNALATPGHTLDHLVYFEPKEKILFVGDTLFSLGCGRLFEGTPEIMFQSLQQLNCLPDETKIYCAHEYTSKNLEFSLWYLKERQPGQAEKYQKVAEKIKRLRQNGHATVPTTMGFEKEFNLFLNAGTVDEFSEIRTLRNGFVSANAFSTK